MQVESLERRKDQVDYIIAQMLDKWTFTRRDATILTANPTSVSITRWSGSSTWEGQRWIRDETRPETLDYYLATVAFRPTPMDEAPLRAANLQLGPMPGAPQIRTNMPSISTRELELAEVPPGYSADQVLARLDEYRREQRAIVTQQQQAQQAARRRRSVQRRVTRAGQQLGLSQAELRQQAAGLGNANASGSASANQRQGISANDLRAARAAARAAAREGGEELFVGDSNLFAGGPVADGASASRGGDGQDAVMEEAA